MSLKFKEIVDLSPLLVPGKEKRRLEIRSFVYDYDNTIMCDIDTMSHIGSHVEAPSHYNPSLYDISMISIAKFIGEGVCVDLTYKLKGESITVEDLEGSVKDNDIVFLHARNFDKHDRPYISLNSAEWMAKHIRLLGIDSTISLEESPKLLQSHKSLLEKSIPIVEGLTNLDKVAGKRFIFIGLPWNVKGLDSSPIRAIALL
ncbi:MAG: cyclase family protein [Nitrososphaeria archaeon]